MRQREKQRAISCVVAFAVYTVLSRLDVRDVKKKQKETVVFHSATSGTSGETEKNIKQGGYTTRYDNNKEYEQ